MEHGSISTYTNKKCRCDACRTTYREYQRRWRAGHPGYFKDKGTKQRKDRRQMLDEIKSVPCADCGGVFPPECMDFDHLPEYEKSFNVGGAVTTRRAWASVLAEIEKCEVVCANCHRIRTRQRRDA